MALPPPHRFTELDVQAFGGAPERARVEQRRIGVAVLLQQPGRAFDVREEEGDGAGGKPGQASVLRLARLAVLAAMPEVLEGLPDRDHTDEDQPDDEHRDHDPLALFVRGDDLEQQPEHRGGL